MAVLNTVAYVTGTVVCTLSYPSMLWEEKYGGYGKGLLVFVRYYLVSSELPVCCQNCWYYNYITLINFFSVTNKFSIQISAVVENVAVLSICKSGFI